MGTVVFLKRLERGINNHFMFSVFLIYIVIFSKIVINTLFCKNISFFNFFYKYGMVLVGYYTERSRVIEGSATYKYFVCRSLIYSLSIVDNTDSDLLHSVAG